MPFHRLKCLNAGVLCANISVVLLGNLWLNVKLGIKFSKSKETKCDVYCLDLVAQSLHF